MRIVKLKSTWLTISVVVSLAGALAAPVRAADGNVAASNDGAALEGFFGEVSTQATPFVGSGKRSLEALLAEGVDVTTESAAEFRRLVETPVPTQTAEPKVIIGPGTRERAHTNYWPARAKVLVTGRFGTSGYRCSGLMLSKDTVVTAGHCVHGTNPTVWANSVVVYPGRNGSSSPYGSCTAKRLYRVVGWVVNKNEE